MTWLFQIRIVGAEECFGKHYGLHYWNEIPIIIMLVINFEIFILIIQKISTKLIPSRRRSRGSPTRKDIENIWSHQNYARPDSPTLFFFHF